MNNQSNNKIVNLNFENIIDIIIRVGILFLLIGWCIDIIRPFVLILVWSAVISIAIHPLHKFLSRLFGGRKIISAVLIILLMLSLLIIPSLLISQSLLDGLNKVKEIYQNGESLIPPPGDRVANWPAAAKPIVDFWQLASDNLQTAVMKYSTQVKAFGIWMIGAFAGFGKGVLQFVASIIIAGVLLIYSGSLGTSFQKLFRKLAGAQGDNYIPTIVSIVQNVVKGILGVAIIQATMAGLGFFIAGVPFAGLWSVLCLMLAIIQVGVGPIAIPIAIYMFSVSDTLTATILAIWLGITLVSDNILKPILLGRNAPAPMLVVFLGSIGGFIYNGFLGLFLGAVILTFGYKLLIVWMNSEVEPGAEN